MKPYKLDGEAKQQNTEEHKQKSKSKVIVFLREGNTDDLGETIKRVKDKGPDGEKNLVEALQTKSFEDDQNLLMQAATYGSKLGFLTFVHAILERKETLGILALVRQLRAVDKDGAPLLFHAAMSKSEECLKAVIRTLKKFLGVEGLKKQLYAIDQKGRNVFMFAVRSPSFDVYNRMVLVLLNYSDPKQSSCPLPFNQHDTTKRNLLHYAAEGSCPGILQEVVDQAKKNSSRNFQELVSGTDAKGRTPIMYVLRDSYRIRQSILNCESIPSDEQQQTSERELTRSSTDEQYHNWRERDRPRAKQRKQKLDILMEEIDDKLESLTQPATTNEAYGQDGLTALMHAARGGLSAFFLAATKIQTLSGRSFSGINSTFLNRALGSNITDETRISRTGMLVEEAAIGGDLDVMELVVVAIDASEAKHFPDVNTTEDSSESNSNKLHRVLESISDRGGCLFTAAIKSRDKRMVKWAAEFIKRHYKNDSKKTWKHLSGNASEKSSLVCAASTPVVAKNHGSGIFNIVLGYLRQAALNLGPENTDPKEFANKLLCDELVVTRKPVSPLGGAVIQSNQVLFKRVYDVYEAYGGKWNRQQILDQLCTRDKGEAYTIDVPAEMWQTVAKAFEEAGDGSPWVKWRDYLTQTVRTLVERGEITRMGALAEEDFPLHIHIPVLLERIGDYEENVIETVTLLVVHARNPLVVWAGASRDIIEAEVNLPMFKSGLRRLRDRLDTLIIKLLDQLPHTVRGVGRELSGINKQLKQDRENQGSGYELVRWMLEPSLAIGASEGVENDDPYDMLDPLQHALDRGSTCLPFVNSALVLDYLHLKFWSTLPSWMARNPFHDTIRTTFYAYEGPPEQKSWLQTGAGELLRFLQGWDKDGDMSPPAELATSLPHSTLSPGLQFALAGIIGKPADYFAVPFVRFIFELISYIVMLGLFCASVSIQKSDEIPLQEWVFYIFVLGLLWREFLEFKQTLPPRPDVIEDKASSSPEGKKSVKGRLIKHPHGVASAISRYLFYDTWNILDTITIVVVAAAFVFRILALGEGWSADEQTSSTPSAFSQNYIFSAQLCLSFSAPLLFSRLLFLSQIDVTLGPMTQVIWVMMSHLARFTVFLLVVMASFALAFHTLFFTCEGLEPDLEDAFGTFGQSLLTMFESMLGSFDFDMLLSANECNRPRWAYEVSLWLLVTYMIIMAILLLNLLIAVMTTAHSAVDAHAEEEFQLSRAKVILQTSHAVENGRLPAPCNLIGVAMGVLVDIPHAIWMLSCVSGKSKEPSSTISIEPITKSNSWQTVEGGRDRLIFAFTMGVIAVATSAILWVISTPWLAWRILRWFFPVGPNKPKGYTWGVVSAVVKLLGWLLLLPVTLVYCCGCALASAILWLWGLSSVFSWMYLKHSHTSVMPEEENTGNFTNKGTDVEQFNVGSLLKMTTGMVVEELVMRVKLKE